ncbi:Uncharacterised protein [Bordetella pertussis]|nr:Uncharacterised protein [Bordetella pertussis]
MPIRSCGTPSRTAPTQPAPVMCCISSSFRRTISRARPSRRAPSPVSAAPLRRRSSRVRPNRASSRCNCWLTALWVRCSRAAAAVRLPVSWTARKARSSAVSILRLMIY